MDITTTALIFILGLCSGIVITLIKQRLYSGTQQTQEELSACQQENAHLKQNWQDHLAEYKSLSTNLKEMSDHINKQINDAEQILTLEEKTTAFPFFSEEATNILKNVSRKKREKSQLDDQPLDYSDSSSGLLNENSNSSTSSQEKH